jgi:hypothetical protein
MVRPARVVAEDQEEPLAAPSFEARQIETLAMESQRIGADKRCDQVVVAGMQLQQRG